MIDWRQKRQDNLVELTLGAHILAYLATIFILIIAASVAQFNFYTTTFLLVGTIFPAALFILLDYRFLQQEHGHRVLLIWNIAKNAFLIALITVVLSNFTGEYLWLFASLYLLPVVLSCITLGQRWGALFAGVAVGCIILLAREMDFAGSQAAGAFESALVLGGIFFLLAWYLGGIIKVETETTEYLYSMAEGEQHRYRELFNFAPVGYLVTDGTGTIREANHAAKRLLGADPAFIFDKTLAAFITPKHRASFHAVVSRVLNEEATGRQEFEVEIKPRRGVLFPARLTVEPATDNKKQITGLRWLLQDISVRRQAESALREKEIAERMRQERDMIARMMDTSPAGIIVLSRYRDIVYTNARVQQILELECAALHAMFNPEMNRSGGNTPGCLAEVFQKVLDEGKPVYNYQGTVNRNKEVTAYLSVSGAPIFNADGFIEQVVLSVDDITKQRKMNEEMLKADKLESLGLLAGGIAHDFNNFLAVILGNISLVNLRNKDKLIAENLEHMEHAVLQARELTHKLFVFTKGGVPARKTLRLQKLLLDTTGFALSGSAAIYEIDIADDLSPVEADEAQIGQVINNILINAVQAMPKGGKVRLAAANISVSGDEKEQALPLPEGEYVGITIADEGIGISTDLLGKIFDPFFSTKPEGSGLGLTTVHSIVQSHGGLMRVESKPGAGATFYIYLPASNKPFLHAVDEKKELYFREGCILIMDDEELIRKSCGDMLQYLGYRVSYARDGAEAVRMYREAAEAGSQWAYDVVIMDLTVPGGVGGKEAIRQIRRHDPKVKAIVSSGYSDDPAVAYYKDYGFSGYVNKPYQIKELSSVLKQVLDDSGENRS